METMPSPPTAPVPLPAVAVVDQDLVTRRRRIARPLQKAGLCLIGGAAGVQIAVRDQGVLGAVLLGLIALGLAAFLWSAPWAGIRPPTSWYLGIEAEGVRLPWLLVPGGQVFLPWWAIDRVDVQRYALVVPLLRLRIRPEAVTLLAEADPLVRQKVLRHGFRVGLQGTSMTAGQARRIIAAVRR